MGDGGHSYRSQLETGQTCGLPQLRCLPCSEFLRSRQKSTASPEENSRKKQEFHPLTSQSCSGGLQQVQAAQILPAIPKCSPPALPHCSCEQRAHEPVWSTGSIRPTLVFTWMVPHPHRKGPATQTPAEPGFAAKPGSLRRCLKMSLLKIFLDSRPNPVI